MKQILTTICFIILCVKLAQATNATNATNATVPTNSSSNATELTTLYIGAFFDLGNKDGYGSLPMAEQAIEEINNNTDLLTGYRLKLVVKSTQGSLGIGQKVLHEFLDTGPRKIMLLGPVEDSLAKSVAAYSGISDVNLLQFSYGTSDLELASRRDLYPNFFRTTTSIASLDTPRIKFIKEYGWDEVGIIYGDSVQYLKLSNQLAGRLQQNNIKVLAEVRLQANDPKRAIRTLKDKGIHVILGMFSLNSVARKMICEAYRERMYGPHYVWMFLNSVTNNWWIPAKGEDSACSDVEMKCQIQNHFSFYHTNVLSSKTSLYKYVNKTGEQIINEYRARVDNYNDTSNRSSLYLNVYDAVWSIAFVLENSRSELLKQGKSFENLTYGDANATDLFRRTAENLNFATPSVGKRVRYYTNGDRKNAIVLRQIVIKDGKFQTVDAGKFNVDTKDLTASSEIHWFAGTPYTKTTETYTYRTIDRTLFIAWVVFAVLGILYALFCLLTLVLNFKKKIVKNSGPVISMLIILGCILNYITVILYGFDYSRVSADQVTRLCRARSWTFAIGFTLSVGGLVAKLWMAYSVLKERFVRSRNVMMFWMLGILVLLLIIDVIILACWETKDPLYRALKNVRSQPEYECFQPITADTFRADIEVVEHCDCTDLTLWLILILAFKVLILLTGGFLAWQTRRLYIPALNDTQHCVSCMFVVVVFCVVGAIVALTATMYPSVYYGIIGALIIIATTLLLVLLFTNKIVRLSCKRKRTKTIVTGETSEESSTCACGTTCAKLCSCCACSAACCITCWSCFPCCNLYFCLRSFFCGSKVHPAESGGGESKSEFYIAGVLQDKDVEIVYLKNELREKETLLSNLGPRRTLKNNSTQTVDDGSYGWDHGDDDSMVDASGSGSDGESLVSSSGKRRFRRAANKVRIFSEGADYSHVRSKVNTGLATPRNSSLSPNSMQPRRNSRMSISSLSNEDLRKLRTTLAEKDDEITRLQKELEALRLRGLAKNSRERSTSEQEPVKTSPKTRQILLIETPATPVPEDERTELITSAVQPSVTPSPSTPKVDDSATSYSGGIKATTGKPAPKTKTQDRTNKKNSVGPGGAWLFGGQSESTREKDKTTKKTSLGSGGLDDKTKTFGDDNTTPSTKNSSEDHYKASLTNVAVSVQQENAESAPKNAENGHASDETEETSQGKISSWLFGNDKNKDSDNNSTHKDDANGRKMDNKDNINKDSGNNSTHEGEENGKRMVDNKDNTKKDYGNNNTHKDEADGKKMDEKDDKKKDSGNKNTEEAEENGKRMDDKDNTKKDSGNNNTHKDEADVKKMDEKGSRDKESATETSLDAAGTGSDNTKVKNELTNDDNIAKDVKGQDDDAVLEDNDHRNIEMIDEEDEDNDEDDDDDDDDDEDDDGEDDEDERDGGKEGDALDATGSQNGAKKNRTRGRRKKLGYGKLKWNAVSKVNTGSGGYTPRKSVKKIPNFKNSYSHVQSRLSTVSEGNKIEKTTEQQSSPQRRRSVTVNKSPLPDYSNVRPKLYNGAARRYNSEMPSTVPKGYLSLHKERSVR